MKGSNKNFHYKKNTSSNKPKLGYNKNEYIEGVHYYAAVISKEFGLKIMPPVSVVEEIIRDSRQISIFFNNIKINFQIRELIRSNEELLETYLQFILQEVCNAKTNISKQKTAEVIEVEVNATELKVSAAESINIVIFSGNIITAKLRVSATGFAAPIASGD